jgi:succinate-acetate transporter protein
MSTVAEQSVTTPAAAGLHTAPVSEAAQVEAQAPADPGGDPAMIGVPTFVIGSIALGLSLVGFLPAGAQAGALPIIIACTGVGQLVAALWAARLGQSAVASIFGIFTGFWVSYAVLLLGLGHDWFGVVPEDVSKTVSAFLLTWVLAVAVLTGVTLRLPLAFTVLFWLIDLALVLVLLGNTQTSPALTKAGGWVVFAFAALGVYLFAGAASVATGGKAFPLGRPVSA